MTKTEGIYFSLLIVVAIAFMAIMHAMQPPEIPRTPVTYHVILEGTATKKYNINLDGKSVALVNVTFIDESSKVYSIHQYPDSVAKINLEEGRSYIFFIEGLVSNPKDVPPTIISAHLKD